MPNNGFPKIVLLWDNAEKSGRTGLTTDGYKTHAHCMLET